jgi:hypothetical protein
MASGRLAKTPIRKWATTQEAAVAEMRLFLKSATHA